MASDPPSPGFGVAGELEDLSTKGEAVRSTLNRLWIFRMNQSAAAPEKMRMNVKLAASILVCFSAARQSRELLANAIIAMTVRMKSRVGFRCKKKELGIKS